MKLSLVPVLKKATTPSLSALIVLNILRFFSLAVILVSIVDQIEVIASDVSAANTFKSGNWFSHIKDAVLGDDDSSASTSPTSTMATAKAHPTSKSSTPTPYKSGSADSDSDLSNVLKSEVSAARHAQNTGSFAAYISPAPTSISRPTSVMTPRSVADAFRSVFSDDDSADSHDNSSDLKNDIRYVPSTDIPLQVGGVVFGCISKVLILILLFFMLLSEIPLPAFINKRIWDHTIPSLGPDHGLAFLGITQIFVTSLFRSHYVTGLTNVSSWLLLSAGILNLLAGIVFRRNAKQLRSLFRKRNKVQPAQSIGALPIYHPDVDNVTDRSPVNSVIGKY